ncbi:MAG TPA: hypothetical protein VF273_04865 [Pelobium sp.]
MLNNNAILFFKKFAIFIVVVFAIDWLIGLGLQKLYFSLNEGQFAETTKALDKAAPDILVFGSSRAQHHYSSRILSQKLGLSIYNAGRDGQFLPYYCAVQDVILQRKTPKIIILDVNIWELGPNEQKYMKLAQLLPYVSEHPVLRKYTAEISEFENLKLISKTYPYNSTLLISIYDHVFKNNEPIDDRGYTALTGRVSETMFKKYSAEKALYDKKRATQNIMIDKHAINYYRQFLQKTKDLNIKTYVVISPTILKEPNTEEKSLLPAIAKKYSNVTFLDYAVDSTYNNHFKLFADEFHLNEIGAQKFSKSLAELIKKDL